MEYVSEIQKGRVVNLSLIKETAGDLKVRLRSPGDKDLPLSASGDSSWSATIPESGDYEIWVVHVLNSSGPTSYQLTVEVR